ncbi:MAG: hypothetical protein HC890_16240 [Chloroflexaceae bacterium]|nr:hypothetical protein [Chloroflexaceae bacterium]
MLQPAIATVLLLNVMNPMLLAQNPPASTFQPGFWQPRARFNPGTPVRLKILNRTDSTLEYELSAQKVTPRPILPGNESALGNLPLPAYVFIYPNDATIGLKYTVSVTSDNVVTLSVEKLGRNTPGDTTLNLHATGAIYIY